MKGLKNLLHWLLERNRRDICRNLLINTGSLFITFSNKNVRFSLCIQIMLRLSVKRKLTRKMPNGLLTCLSMTLLPEALYHLLTSARRVTLRGYRFKLICFKSSEKNRLQNCLTFSNIQLENIVLDTFGKSAQAMLEYWIRF